MIVFTTPISTELFKVTSRQQVYMTIMKYGSAILSTYMVVFGTSCIQTSVQTTSIITMTVIISIRKSGDLIANRIRKWIGKYSPQVILVFM